MEKYPLLETVLLFYYNKQNKNWQDEGDQLIVLIHYFMINNGFRIFIDQQTVSFFFFKFFFLKYIQFFFSFNKECWNSTIGKG
jgi:hypothetical protein